MFRFSAVIAAVVLLSGQALAEEALDAPSPEAKALLASLHPRSGHIALPTAEAELNLSDAYDFLPADEAKRVLVEGWGNPPDMADGVLGMILPHGKTFLDEDAWAAVITYENTFYVSDKEANKADYEKVLQDMRAGEAEENAAREKAGYPPIHLVGWAQPPSYDKAHHDLVWARQIKFGDQDVDTLNYDVRHLGRRGVLSLNIVSSVPHLAEIRAAAPDVARQAEFVAGARYADHAWLDKSAGYGLAGLVAAGAGLAVAKKAGLLAVIFVFAKKGLVLLVAAGAAAMNWLRGVFGRKPKPASTASAGTEPSDREPTVS